MESNIRVTDTPNNMYNAFEREKAENVHYSIRYYEVVDRKPTAEEYALTDEEWTAKYGDEVRLFDVRVRYPEVKKPLTDGYTYSSWASVEKTINKKIKETEQAKGQER